ncbi:hypothetical protein N0V83_009153 [Neocucurbitaria cava]|uniref:Uncharacterized protein n=1 Tax=Neocucurbitaria cava TaxID=798079 RepID=A0A9W8Y100_9PLEO|nr:hypothetical protein N0V83_009153 [Neocucurbitaria cava]
MPAPLAKGIIIAASVLVAAGIAIYESPQVRQWVDQSRRKIAVALHSLGDEIQPQQRHWSESCHDYDSESRKRRRDDMVRRNRNELIRRAREEGVAVDLDELAKISSDDFDMAERRSRPDRTKSFDDMVGSDGMLKQDAKATGHEDVSNSGLRKRGAAGLAAASGAAAAAMANPFSDDQVLIDDDDEDEASSPKPFEYIEPGTRESSATIEADPMSPPAATQLIDLTPEALHSQSENQRSGSLTHLETSETDKAAQSFYSFTSSTSHLDEHSSTRPFFDDNEAEHLSTGTLTPRSERSMTTGASIADSHADDIAVLSLQNDTDHDARSEVFSEGGFTDADFSEAGFSELGHGDRAGVMTPNSWTDVGSDDESDWGGAAQHGHVSQEVFISADGDGGPFAGSDSRLLLAKRFINGKITDVDCNTTFRDPTQYVLNRLRDMAFRTAVAAANITTDLDLLFGNHSLAQEGAPLLQNWTQQVDVVGKKWVAAFSVVVTYLHATTRIAHALHPSQQPVNTKWPQTGTHVIINPVNPVMETQLANRVKHDMKQLTLWADELPRIKLRCEQLYEEARKAQERGEYGRVQRRLESLRGFLKGWMRSG